MEEENFQGKKVQFEDWMGGNESEDGDQDK